ncbi:MAG: PD-(D/E)XK nuclease family protein [Dissulfurimicrobium sp.]|uniref:PD-(D/E)XK nuclease family protein n=1 Tax=Dissulfurimicrobium sp. TaxID=2022436 RepID=UPI00404B20E8
MIFQDLIQWLLQRCEKEADFSSCAVVFPGKRPSLYLRRMLGETLGRPFIPPCIFDIDSFITRLAGLQSSEPMRRDAPLTELLHLLYKTAKKISKKGITKEFESFFPWGLRLLEVFDEFGTGLITPEKIERAVPHALKDAGLGGDVGIWPILPEIYRAWMDTLRESRIWTRGERYRLAVSAMNKLAKGESDLRPLPAWLEPGLERICMAGFSVFTRAEEEVFSVLLNIGAAKVMNEETCPDIALHPRLFLHPCTDLHSQIFTARKLLNERQRPFVQQSFPPDEEVIVLPDTNALIPVLEWLAGIHGTPFNISMGYPLEHTPPARLLGLILDAQEGRDGNRYHVTEYLNVLRHPYIKGLRPPNSNDAKGATTKDDGCFRQILHWIEGWIAKKRPAFVDCKKIVLAYENEGGPHACFLKDLNRRLFLNFEEAKNIGEFANSLLKVLDLFTGNEMPTAYPLAAEFISTLIEFIESLSSGAISSEPITPNGFRFIFRYLTRAIRIPFSGLPLDGLQILGVLETRCLNFKKVMVFDMNEGIIPPNETINPLLPPGLRRHLGLPDNKKAVDISRHHLHRLISNAEEAHLFFAYGGENVPSRFIEEIIWKKEKYAQKIIDESKQQKLAYITPPYISHISRPKDRVLDRLSSFVFSPTSIDTYLACPFRFYACFCLGLNENNTLKRDAMGPDVIGKLIHRILKQVYEPYIGKEIAPAMIDSNLAAHVDQALYEEFDSGELDGLDMAVRLLREVIFYRLWHFLRLDKENISGQGRILLGLEKEYETKIMLNSRPVRLKGILDRIERDRDGMVWVIDYKTGGKVKIPRGDTSGRFEREILKKTVGSFQLPFYLILCDKAFGLSGDWTKANAAIYELKGIGPKTVIKDVQKTLFKEMDNHTRLMEEFYIPALKSLISEIIDPDTPFSADSSDSSYCGFCPYRHGLCKAARLSG